MNKEVCESFQSVWDNFPDTLTQSNEYHGFNDSNFLNSYCFGNQCDRPLEKMNAVFFHLVNKFFGSSGLFNNNVKNNINAVEYILIWLSHMLNLKDNTGNILTNFYKVYINNQEKYKNPINGVDGCSNYDEFIYTKKELMEITNEKLSRFYAPFKSLCNMYSRFNDRTSDCTKCLSDANEFVETYNKLNGDSSITNDSSCNKLLCTLSNDYDHFKKEYSDVKCSNLSFPAIEKPKNCVENSKQNPVQRLEPISQDASSSSSITNKLFTVLSIFGAIAFFLGISYKYSLFGFRKRFKKQQIREKIKNIKKKINN
ncbi:PIR protein [Plasmodium yoelii]|uniref:PIR protein n=2 Tax=Plasmodium yoelii TaxID=5861 RepID=A0AAE9WLL6_PLAYO|nr:PIR protein [Plasmodium yoelii]WBY54624.1 PIR protein [Plasmodium yoelii yoelii]VTZ71618.1 PIR protein [Plasmodium yoelii]|eukprot:XP_022810842.1 PIR protein [Plasmodium yoelii]